MALRNDARVMTSLGRRSAVDHLDDEASGRVGLLEQPAVRRRAYRRARERHAERLGQKAIVDAVPIVLQCPRLRIIDDSERRKSLLGERACPHLLAAAARRRCRSRAPRLGTCPVSIGPPGTTTAGTSTEAAAMSSAGIVLSQPPSRTTPSIGLARSISSIAIAAMLRQSIAVGRTCVSPSDTTGRLSGMPPAS